MELTKAQKKAVQRSLNTFTNGKKKYVAGVHPLIVDGVFGAATKKRIRWVKFHLGYGATLNANSSKVTSFFIHALRHPKDPKYNTPQALKVGAERRRKQRRRHAGQVAQSYVTAGVTRYDGKPVAKWMVPYLKYARAHGWRGGLNSGWRSPAYSDSLCRNMCGAPSCPGRCAGRASNHAGSSMPRGAIDVSDYYTFGRVIRGYRPKSGWPIIFNALGARDPVHFSASGR